MRGWRTGEKEKERGEVKVGWVGEGRGEEREKGGSVRVGGGRGERGQGRGGRTGERERRG